MMNFKSETDTLITALPIDWEGTDAEQIQRLVEAALRRAFADGMREAVRISLDGGQRTYPLQTTLLRVSDAIERGKNP